jgi:hypothetical protein
VRLERGENPPGDSRVLVKEVPLNTDHSFTENINQPSNRKNYVN